MRHTVKVTFSDGSSLATDINGTREEIEAYYIGKPFNLVIEEDRVVTVVAVEFMERE